MKAKYTNNAELMLRMLTRTRLDTDECWEWQYALNTQGYGVTYYKGRLWQVHRLYFMLRGGDMSECVLHTCDNSKCYNHKHLYAGTQHTNMQDKKARSGYKSRGKHLSAAERNEIGNLVAMGFTNSEIAKEFRVGIGTITRIRNSA